MKTYDQDALREVTGFLFARRDAILNNWRLACQQDASLGKVSALSREEFNNLLPVVLDILEQRLLGKQQEADLAYVAAGHGLHRWHKSHELLESVRELGYLSQALYNELETFVDLFPGSDTGLMMYVHRVVARVMHLTISGSLEKYDELQRLQAISRTNTLERALENMNGLATERSDMLRKSSHDLRGSVGMFQAATTLLQMEGLSAGDQKRSLDMLNRNLGNVQSMLTGLMDLSRLESGLEKLHIETIDAGIVLRDLVLAAEGMAKEKNIILIADGPPTLVVQCDKVKLQRVAQNILVNALKYTGSDNENKAIVSVAWSSEGNYRWSFSVQDSGPGMPGNVAGIFAQQFRPTIETTSQMGPDQAEPTSVHPISLPEIPTGSNLKEKENDPDKGEGVGLQIVKHLCDLLDANLDIESQKGRGTLFRVRLPVKYSHV